MQNRKIDNAIVIGANGFIGNYLLEELLSKEIFTYAVVKKHKGKDLRIINHKYLKVIEIDDALNIEQIKPSLNTVCFNLAWSGVSGDKRGDYHLQLENVENSLILLEKAAHMGINCFIGASTISEIDARVNLDKDGLRVSDRYVYASAKLAMNYMSKTLASKYNVEYINGVIANLYGEYGLDAILLHYTILKLLKNEETAFTSAEQFYDFLYVKDAARGLYALAEAGRGNSSYYIGSGAARKLKDYISYIGKIIAPKRELGFGKIKSTEAALSREYFNIQKIQEDTGYTPIYKFEEKIIDVIAWYQKEIDKTRVML